MNVVRLTDEQRRGIHVAICHGEGIAGAARRAGIDRRTVQRLIEGDGGDAFLLSLAKPEEIERDDWAALNCEHYHNGERETSLRLRTYYEVLLRGEYGDTIEDRLLSEAERLAKKRRAEAERQAEEEARRKAEEEKSAKAEYAKKMELYERLTAAMKETYGDQYDAFEHIHKAFMVRFGTYPEYQAGIGGAGHEAEREEWRRWHTVQLGSNWIQPDRWAKYRKDFEKRAQELLAGLSKLYAEHEGDLRAAGYLKATGER